MSNWTHVLATFEIGGGEVRDDEWETIVGKVTGPESNEYDRRMALLGDRRYLPAGSEGSLNVDVAKCPVVDGFHKYIVVVHGGLRGHEDPERIVDWFSSVCNGINYGRDRGIGLAQAVCDIENVLNGRLVARFDSCECTVERLNAYVGDDNGHNDNNDKET